MIAVAYSRVIVSTYHRIGVFTEAIMKLKSIGLGALRVDGWEKITGAAKYTGDLDFGNSLLYAAVVESPHAHAKIKSINAQKAEKVKGWSR